MSLITKWLFGLFALALVGWVGYSYGVRSTTNQTQIAPSTGVNNQASTIDTPAMSGAKDEYPSNWKTLTLTELGRMLNYPADWQILDFTKKTETDELMGGTWWYATYAGKTPTSNQIGFSIEKKDYKRLPIDVHFDKPIDPTWKNEQIAAEAKATVLYSQQLSSHALLVATYANAECSPIMLLEVYAPLTLDYPNLEMQIPYDTSKEPAVMDYMKEQETKGEPTCDLEAVFQTIVDGWATNGFPTSLQSNLDIARGIANSIRPIQ
ncbi:hypothetical protein HY524_00290 [Candidatus Berkelbacteria bacterium]|nr:hypothetical protein [Candidatus Berkelbacteria bacterium]